MSRLISAYGMRVRRPSFTRRNLPAAIRIGADEKLHRGNWSGGLTVSHGPSDGNDLAVEAEEVEAHVDVGSGRHRGVVEGANIAGEGIGDPHGAEAGGALAEHEVEDG